MQILAIVLVASACGPIYPASNPSPAPEEPVSSSGPPGGQMDPYDPTHEPPREASREAPPPREAPAPREAPPPRDAPPPREAPPRREAPSRGAPTAEMSAPPPAPTTTSKLSRDAETFVTEHNRYRAKHCAAPLSWSPQLAASSQKWADTLKAKGCRFGHSGSKSGENLAAGTTGALPPEEVVRMWYDEVKIYDFKKPGFSMETGHFTQVVWLDTTQVGCGMAQCKGNDIWVCQYERPGNWEGQFGQKVRPTSCK